MSTDEGTEPTRGDLRRRFVAAAEELRDRGWQWDDIATVSGYDGAHSVSAMYHNAKKGTRHAPSLDKVESIEEALARARVGAMPPGSEEEEDSEEAPVSPEEVGDEASLQKRLEESRGSVSLEDFTWFIETAEGLLMDGYSMIEVAAAAGYQTTSGMDYVLKRKGPPSANKIRRLRMVVENGLLPAPLSLRVNRLRGGDENADEGQEHEDQAEVSLASIGDEIEEARLQIMSGVKRLRDLASGLPDYLAIPIEERAEKIVSAANSLKKK